MDSNTSERNEYDAIARKIVQVTGRQLASTLIGIDLPELTPVPNDLVKAIVKRQLDFLAETEDAIYHIEFQFWNHSVMHHRMHIYYALMMEQFDKPIYQYVIYCGKEPCTMKDSIENNQLTYKYVIQNVGQMDENLFLQTDVPEIVIWAILAKQSSPPNETIRKISRIIKNKLGDNKEKLGEVANLLRYLTSVKHNFEVMRTLDLEMNFRDVFHIEYDPLYIEGESVGEAKGMEKGMEKGIEKGMEKAKMNLVLNLIQLGIEDAIIQKATSISLEEIQKLKAQQV